MPRAESQLPILDLAEIDPAEQPFLYPGRWWHAENDRIVCDLCPRECVLKPGDRGFCFVRQNLGGQMMLTTYGRSTGFCIDPIEKKPLNQFYPGTSVLSFGTAGCNLGCKFCQNWDISKSREIERLSEKAGPEDIARAAQTLGCQSVAFTYNDPVIWAEYAIETARACRQLGIKAVAVTAGYITEAARGEFYAAMDAANVDLKAFSEEFYFKLTLSHIQPVLETLRWLKAETDVWFEITNLIIPDANDSPDELQRMCDWILENVGDEVPVHFTAFHPDFRLKDRGPTPPDTLIAAHEIALATGLKYPYTGNVNDAARQSTYCPNCRRVVIERNWYELGQYALAGPNCQHCGTRIAGHFANQPGDWGRRRLPVDMRRFVATPLVAAPPKASPAPATVLPPPLESAPMTSSTAQVRDLSPPQALLVVQTAARIIKAACLGRSLLLPSAGEWGDENQALAEQPVAGVFVTLKRQGHLRSCCGTFGNPMPLREALHQAAVRTATDDPRFPPISRTELPYLELDVWLLGTPEEIEESGEDRAAMVTVGRHGLQVVRGNQRGLLLPGVAVEHQWDAEEFLNRTCLKAGLPASAWKDQDTSVFRFEGREQTGPLLSEMELANWQGAKAAFSSRDLAAYAQFCGQTLRTLLEGAVPLYYCPSVTDGNVNGVSIRAVLAGTSQEWTATRLNLKQTMPLQATLFGLCEELARVLSQSRAPVGEIQISITVLSDPILHGTVASPDLAGFSSSDRAMLVAEGNRRAWVFDGDKSPEELLQIATDRCDVTEPDMALVMSLLVASSRSRGEVVDRPQAQPGGETRPTAVAGTFYPATADEINHALDDLLHHDVKPARWSAAMIPHAGWIYSGKIAARTLEQIDFPKTVIIFSPKHTPHGVEWAVAPHANWSLPNGELAADTELAKRLAERIPGLELDAASHRLEHGIEVELPLIRRLAPETKIVAITIGGGTLERLSNFAEKLAEVLNELEQPPLLLISSDMNHFANETETRRLDELALAALDQRDADGLFHVTTKHHVSMCGMRPAVIVLKTLALLDRLRESQRTGYSTTAETTGDTARVVGYAGMLFR